MLPALIPIIGGVVSTIGGIISEFVEDKDKANEIASKIEGLLSGEITKLLEVQQAILLAEMGGNWLQRSWRPILMLSIVAIIVNNYVFAPYRQAVFGTSVTLELPSRLWDLLMVGVGGYVVGRSAEKIVTTWRKDDK